MFGDDISKVTVPSSRLAGSQRLHQAVVCNLNDSFPLCIHLTHLMNDDRCKIMNVSPAGGEEVQFQIEYEMGG